MTAAYLALRLVLFGQVVRESTLNAAGARYFGLLFQHHLANVLVGRVSANLAPWAVVIACAIAAVILLRRLPPSRAGGAGAAAVLRAAVVDHRCRADRCCGYESPRHVYLAAAGWALALGFSRTSRGSAPGPSAAIAW